MRRRKFIIGTGALAAGGAAALGTGAFSQMTSGERAIEADVVNDSDALLALEAFDPEEDDNGENGQFARETDDGELEIDFEGFTTPASPPTGDGVNPGSEYEFDNVFKVQNGDPNTAGGTGEIVVWIDHDIDELTFKTIDAQTPIPDMTEDPGARVPIESREEADDAYGTMSPGAGNVLAVGIDVDATDLDNDDTIEGEFTVVAENSSHRE